MRLAQLLSLTKLIRRGAGTDNVYDVIVKASDGTLFDTQAIAVTVTAVNDNAPVITSAAMVSVPENQTAVTTVTATDADVPGQTLTYTLNGGVDAALFTLNSGTGALAFIAAPDFENPTDAGTDNVYDVIVKASDGTLFDTQAIAVTVTNVVAWAELGDAGGLPGTAQTPVGVGALTAISGTIISFADDDMYRIVSLGGLFTATTVGPLGTLGDTQLFLFDAAGFGIIGNDDTSPGIRSTISAVLAPGTYYLAISGYDHDPTGASGEIFKDNFPGQQTPTGPGGPGPITGWNDGLTMGTYNIALTGANFVA